MTEWGRYEVTGNREYRGNPPGSLFVDAIERNAMKRAVDRGDIRLIERVKPELPARWGMPAGWPTAGEE